MISNEELDRYRKPNGDLPGVSRLMAMVEAVHPEWDFFRVGDHVRRLYAASADRIRAETDAIRASTDATWAKVDHLHAQRRRLSSDGQEPTRPQPRIGATWTPYEATARRNGFSGQWRYVNGKEPQAWDLLGRDVRFKQYSQVRRIRNRWAEHVKAHGSSCRVCGEHFKPRDGNQKRCRSCIDAGRKVSD